MFLNTVHPSMSSGDSGSEQRPNKTELGNKELCQGNYVPARTRKGVFLLLHEQTSSESMNANLQDPRHMADLQAGREGAVHLLPSFLSVALCSPSVSEQP